MIRALALARELATRRSRRSRALDPASGVAGARVIHSRRRASSEDTEDASNPSHPHAIPERAQRPRSVVSLSMRAWPSAASTAGRALSGMRQTSSTFKSAGSWLVSSVQALAHSITISRR